MPDLLPMTIVDEADRPKLKSQWEVPMNTLFPLARSEHEPTSDPIDEIDSRNDDLVTTIVEVVVGDDFTGRYI